MKTMFRADFQVKEIQVVKVDSATRDFVVLAYSARGIARKVNKNYEYCETFVAAQEAIVKQTEEEIEAMEVRLMFLRNRVAFVKALKEEVSD